MLLRQLLQGRTHFIRLHWASELCYFGSYWRRVLKMMIQLKPTSRPGAVLSHKGRYVGLPVRSLKLHDEIQVAIVLLLLSGLSEV